MCIKNICWLKPDTKLIEVEDWEWSKYKERRFEQGLLDNLISRRSDIGTYDFTYNKDGSYKERIPDGSVSREEFAILVFKRDVIYVGKDGFLTLKELGNIPNTHFDLLDGDRNGRLNRTEVSVLGTLWDSPQFVWKEQQELERAYNKTGYAAFASETFRPRIKCLKVPINPWLELVGDTTTKPLWGNSFLFNEGSMSKFEGNVVVERALDTIPQDWDNKKPSAGVVAGYVVCVIYCFVITIIWSFRIKKKDSAQFTNVAIMPVTLVHVSERGPTRAVIPDEITLAPAPRGPSEEVISDGQHKKKAKKIIFGHIVSVFVGVIMYIVLLSRDNKERLKDDDLENFGIAAVVTAVSIFRDSLDIIISSCRPNDVDTHFKLISVVNDINAMNLRRPQDIVTVLVFLFCDLVVLLMLVLSSLLVDPWIKIFAVSFDKGNRVVKPFSICSSVDAWIERAQYCVIPAIIIFFFSQYLIWTNATTRTTMTRNLPIYEMAMAVTFTSVVTFWEPLKADDLNTLVEGLDDENKREEFKFQNCEIVWYSSMAVVIILWTDLLKSVLQYFYLAGTSVGYADKSKINILATFFKKSISQCRFDYFVLFLIFSFVTISGDLAPPFMNFLGPRIRNCPPLEEKANSICNKRRALCPSLNFNAKFPCGSDPSVVTPEVYNVDYNDLTVKISLECYLEAHIDFGLMEPSKLETLMMMRSQCERTRQVGSQTHILVVLSGTENTCTLVLTFATSRQYPVIPVLIMGLSLLLLTLWAFVDHKRIQEVLNGDEVEYINAKEIF
jgi:hypothetical protein